MRGPVPKIHRSLMQQPGFGLSNPTFRLFLIGTSTLSLSTIGFFADVLPLAFAGVLNGVCVYSLYTVTHEAVHRLAHPRPRMNEWLGRLAAAFEGITFPMFRIIHLQHHAFTNDPERDPDYVIGRKPRWLLPVWTLVRLAQDNTFMVRQRLWSHKRRLLVEHVLTVGIQMGVVTAAGLTGHGREVLCLWVIPFIVSGAVLELSVAWAVHYPHESQHPLENTRLFPGRLWQTLTFNQSYHLVHHLWPRIPWFRYHLAAGVAQRAVQTHQAGLARKS